MKIIQQLMVWILYWILKLELIEYVELRNNCVIITPETIGKNHICDNEYGCSYSCIDAIKCFEWNNNLNN